MWGVNIPIVKYSVGEVDAFVFNAVRLVFATIALGIFAWFEARRGQSIRGPFSKSRFAVFAILTGLVYMWMFMFGVTRTTAGNVALLLSSMPMWTAVLSYFFIQERLGRITWIGLAITLSGTLTIVFMGKEKISFSSAYLMGNLFMMCAALTWATGTIVSRKLLFSIGPMTLAFWSALVTTPVHVLSVSYKLIDTLPELMVPRILLATIYSGLFSTGLAYALWHVGVRQLGGSHAAVYQNFVTLVAVLGGWFFLGEQPLTTQLIGGGLIIAGVLVMRQGRKAK